MGHSELGKSVPLALVGNKMLILLKKLLLMLARKENYLMKALLSIASIIAAISAYAMGNSAISAKVSDLFELAPRNSVSLNGILGESLNASLKGVKSKDVDMLVSPFKFRTEKRLWKSEFWGKWFTSAALAYDYSPSGELDGILKYAAAELIKTQDAQGAIRTVAPEWEFKLMPNPNDFKNGMTWDVWGRKYVLLGLIAEYDRTGNAEILNAAKRHADYIIERIGKDKKDICNIGLWFGVASSSILEPMALLYMRSGEERYLKFAEYIIENQYKSPFGMDMFRKMRDNTVVTDIFPKAGDPLYFAYAGGGSKAYETMSCFEGLLEMYRISGNPDYLKAAENLAASVRDTEIIITGSSAINEKWRRSKFAQNTGTENWQETCVTATWIKFCSQLLRLTGNPIYAGDIELATFNALISAQKPDGSWWCHHSPLNGARKAATPQCLRDKALGVFGDDTLRRPGEPEFIMNCCVASGPRALFLIPKLVCMASREGAVFNLYEKGTATIPIGESPVTFTTGGLSWGDCNTATISMKMSGKKKFSLRLYMPIWSKDTRVSVNGSAIGENIVPGRYLEISRQWQSGDFVKIDFDAKVLIKSIPGHGDIFSLQYGPFVLSMDRRFEADFNKPADISDKDGAVLDARPLKLKGAHLAFDVPLKDGGFRRFINYSDAGRTWDKTSSFATIFTRKGRLEYVPAGNFYKKN